MSARSGSQYQSLTLAIEIFNRPSEIARTHAVLILLQHSFELLLKALILEKTGRVHEADGRFSYSFARCLTVATEELKALTPDERSTLAILDAQRDQAAHYYAEVSEASSTPRPIDGYPLRQLPPQIILGVPRVTNADAHPASIVAAAA